MFTIGNDAEFFLAKDGKVISAVGKVGGSKEKPLPLKHGAIQEDNVLVEVNSIPASNLEEWLTNCKNIYNDAKIHLKGYELKTLSSYLMDQAELNHPQALELGCEPDYDAWNMSINDKPDGESTNLRTAGGHVHVGVDLGGDPMQAVQLIRYMDIYLGVPSVNFDKDTQRRKLYGKAGAFRMKDYGVEYRSLSNFWYASDDLIEWVYFATEQAVDAWQQDKYNIMGNHHGDVAQCINTGDVSMADMLTQRYNIKVM